MDGMRGEGGTERVKTAQSSDETVICLPSLLLMMLLMMLDTPSVEADSMVAIRCIERTTAKSREDVGARVRV